MQISVLWYTDKVLVLVGIDLGLQEESMFEEQYSMHTLICAL